MPEVQDVGRLIVALDGMPVNRALLLAQRLRELPGFWGVKINDILFEEGFPVVGTFKGQGVRVFADGKYHDIPNTVGNTVRKLAQYKPDFVTVHCAGLNTMVRAAVDALGDAGQILGVTMLTSLDDENVETYYVHDNRADQVLAFALEGAIGGAAGFICSGLEAHMLRERDWRNDWEHLPTGWTPLRVVPGVRFPTGDAGDQKAVVTPQQAIRDGATHIVVGRPITTAPDPVDAAQLFIDAINEALGTTA